MKVSILLFCSLVVSSTLAAQEESFFSEIMEVRVTNVDVVVTGRDGKPVTGLTASDFELYEDGVAKEITNFLEMRGGPSASLTATGGKDDDATISSEEDIRRRDITIFIDNAALHPMRRNQILPPLQSFLDEAVRPGDTVGIAVWNLSLEIALEPTSDRSAIEAAVKRLASRTALGSAQGQAREEFYQEIARLIRGFKSLDPPELPPWFVGVGAARMYASKATHDLKQRVEALKSVIAWRRGVEGRKILVLLTAELPLNPAEEAFLYLDGMRDQFAEVTSSALAESRQFEFPSLINEITEVANSSGVTLYPIDAAGKDSGMVNRDASGTAWMTSAGRTEMAVTRASLRSIATETGGIALTGSDNWKLAFDTISNDLDTYYSLGYRSTGERQDRMKKIEVRLKDKRHSVRTRRAVIEKTVASEMQDAVAANLFRPSSTNEMEIEAVTGAATQPSAEAVLIPVTVTFPMDNLTLVPDGDDLTGRFAVYAAFLRKDGAVSKVARQGGEVRFPAKDLRSRREVTVKIDVTTDAQTNGLSVGVLDEMSGATGFAGVKWQ